MTFDCRSPFRSHWKQYTETLSHYYYFFFLSMRNFVFLIFWQVFHCFGCQLVCLCQLSLWYVKHKRKPAIQRTQPFRLSKLSNALWTNHLDKSMWGIFRAKKGGEIKQSKQRRRNLLLSETYEFNKCTRKSLCLSFLAVKPLFVYFRIDKTKCEDGLMMTLRNMWRSWISYTKRDVLISFCLIYFEKYSESIDITVISVLNRSKHSFPGMLFKLFKILFYLFI